jgi:hypothetical protein
VDDQVLAATVGGGDLSRRELGGDVALDSLLRQQQRGAEIVGFALLRAVINETADRRTR